MQHSGFRCITQPARLRRRCASKAISPLSRCRFQRAFKATKIDSRTRRDLADRFVPLLGITWPFVRFLAVPTFSFVARAQCKNAASQQPAFWPSRFRFFVTLAAHAWAKVVCRPHGAYPDRNRRRHRCNLESPSTHCHPRRAKSSQGRRLMNSFEMPGFPVCWLLYADH